MTQNLSTMHLSNKIRRISMDFYLIFGLKTLTQQIHSGQTASMIFSWMVDTTKSTLIKSLLFCHLILYTLINIKIILKLIMKLKINSNGQKNNLKDSSRKFVIIDHIYAGLRVQHDSNSFMEDLWRDDYRDRYFNFLLKYKNQLVIEIAGHDHWEDLRYYED